MLQEHGLDFMEYKMPALKDLTMYYRKEHQTSAMNQKGMLRFLWPCLRRFDSTSSSGRGGRDLFVILKVMFQVKHWKPSIQSCLLHRAFITMPSLFTGDFAPITDMVGYIYTYVYMCVWLTSLINWNLLMAGILSLFNSHKMTQGLTCHWLSINDCEKVLKHQHV